jgi:segregation and condensation protein B
MEEKETQAAETQPQEEALSEGGATPEVAESPAVAVEEQSAPESSVETVETREEVSAEELLQEAAPEASVAQASQDRTSLKSLLEAIVYILNEPMPLEQIALALGRPLEEVKPVLDELIADTAQDARGVFLREVAGGYQMATKPEHHEVIRQFVKNLKQPLKLSQAALETLAVIAYKQPITAPEIIEIRGVQGAGVLKTLLDRKLITTAGRKNVIGKPILYKTTKDFLTQFGLKDLGELPTLKEFEELKRQSISDEEPLQPELAIAAEEETEALEQQAAAEAPSHAADQTPEDPS